MAVKYKTEKMKIGFGKDKKEAYVGRIQLGDTIDTEKLEEQVAVRTLLPQSVVHHVLSNIVKSVFHFVEDGRGVRLGNIGILKPAITTRSAEDDGDVEVTKVRMRYIQSTEMREAVERLAIRKIGDSSAVEGDEEDDDEGTGGSTGGGGQEFT